MESFIVLDNDTTSDNEEKTTETQPPSISQQTNKETHVPEDKSPTQNRTTVASPSVEPSTTPKQTIATKALTESVRNSQSSKNESGLHLSRWYPALAERIQEKMQDEIEGRDGSSEDSFFRAAPESTFILPDLSHLSTELRVFIEKDLFQQSHNMALEKRKLTNWHKDLTELRPLMTQGDGNCLMHAVSLGMFGVHDRQLNLRKALYRALTEKTAELFKQRWRIQAANINRGSAMTEEGLKREWELIVEEASPVPVNISAPRPQFKYLGQMHIFVLAHILRRPIIVYAESKARDISTEDTIFELPPDERMDGIYLPLLLPREATRSDPLALAFHSSHFAPLVATFPDFKLTSEAFDGFEAYFPIVDVNHVPFHKQCPIKQEHTELWHLNLWLFLQPIQQAQIQNKIYAGV